MSEKRTKLNRAGVRAATTNLRMLIIQGTCLFTAAGAVSIARFWLYLIYAFILGAAATVILVKKTPELLNERGSKKKNIEKKDFIVLMIYFLFLLFGIPIIAGLDSGRFGWTEKIAPGFKTGLCYLSFISGAVVFLSENIIITFSMLENRHFEGLVRIQSDREHRVISTGLYRVVRHPGYFGMLLAHFAMPLMLGSLIAFIPSVIAAALLLLRTYWEDQTLQNELKGYKEYMAEVKYRLIPGVW